MTRMYVGGEPDNARNRVSRGVRDLTVRARLIVPLALAPKVEAGALTGSFEIVPE